MKEPKQYRSGKRRGFYVDFRDQLGRRKKKRFSGPLAYDQAKRFLSRIISGNEDSESTELLAATVYEYLRIIESTGKIKQSTASNYSKQLSVFVRYCEISQIQYVRQVQKIHLENYAGWWFKHAPFGRWNQGASNATYNRYLAAVSAFFSWCHARSIVETNPLAGQSRLMAKEHHKPVRYFESTEIRSILEYWKSRDPLVSLFFRLMTVTGARVNELVRLQWEDVSIDHGTITFCRDTKSWRPRTLPLHSLICESLEQMRRPKANGLVFARPDGTALYKRMGWHWRLNLACRELGLPRKDLKALRATAATNLFAAGADAVTVKEALGHQSITTTMRYAAAVPARLREVVLRMGDSV